MPTDLVDLPEAPMCDASTHKTDLSRGRWLLVLAAVLWSSTGLFVKVEALRGIPGPMLACLRALFAATCLVPFVRRSDVRFRRGLVPMAGSFAAMNVLFLTAMTLTTAGAAAFLQYTATPWSFLLGWLVLGESSRRGNLLAVVMALAGIICIVACSPGEQSLLGNLLATTSGLAFAGVIISLRHLRDESPTFLVLVNQSVSCLVLLPWLAAHPPDLTSTQWLLLAAFGVVQMSIPYLLFARGLKYVSAQEASLIALLEPVLTPAWLALLGWELAPASTWVGGGLIVGGLLARYTIFAGPGGVSDGSTATDSVSRRPPADP